MTRVVVLIPAHNEAASIGHTVSSVIAQTVQADRIVVIPNGCSDDTAAIARQFDGVIVHEMPSLRHRKSEALNRAWNVYAYDADFVVCVDADTELAPNAVEDWLAEFGRDATLGGSRAKFTMRGRGYLTRMQRAEYAQGVDDSLRRGWTSILAGAGCMFRNRVLHEIALGEVGPWSYESQVEDFELTYQIRRRGYASHVSPTIRAYTDAMKTWRALWGQRMKWQIGTSYDLLQWGVNRHTRADWQSQLLGFLSVWIRLWWVSALIVASAYGNVHVQYWWLALGLVYVAKNYRHARVIPHRDRWDVVLPLLVFPYEVYNTVAMIWFSVGWANVATAKIFRRAQKDRWTMQHRAEGSNHELHEQGHRWSGSDRSSDAGKHDGRHRRRSDRRGTGVAVRPSTPTARPTVVDVGLLELFEEDLLTQVST